MELFFIISTFVLGAIIGSFLNVTFYQPNTGRGFGGRSFCMSCAKELGWYELIPIMSFLFQKGRCLKCRSKISFQYPIVELLTGFVFTAIFASMPHQSVGDFVPIFYYWAIFSILIMISVYDIRLKIIPNAPVYTFIVLSLLAPIIMNGALDSQIILMLFRKSGFTMKSEIPFGPFLIAGAFITLVGNFDLGSIANLFQSLVF